MIRKMENFSSLKHTKIGFRINNRGLSLIEVVIAVFVAGLAIAPTINLLSSTNRETSTSIYQVMAAYYSDEIIEQLTQLNISPGFKRICEATGKDLPELLESMNTDLGDMIAVEPRKVSLMGLKLFLLISPLTEGFNARLLEVHEVTGSSGNIPGRFYRIVIKVGWNYPGDLDETGSSKHIHESVFFLNRDL
ncbi:MAG: prepilin-type N-terminal cleavage/methylation domain-containing protein [Candidatus Riflebacteria bacterium]|nr:prepilin-type N-terminal cleavage/methylation domain-containing protein [Candidatus Riflebacteria bacterium]